MKRFNPHPIARAAATVLAVAGTLLAKSVVSTAAVWIIILLPLMASGGILRHHMRFITVILAPISVALLLVWGWVVGAPPGAPVGSSPVEGARFACLVIFRLALLGGIGQLCLNTIPPDQMAPTFRQWGLKGEGLVMVMGSLAVGPEMKIRAEQILTARYARGLVPNRTLLARVGQLPYLLRPLLAWALRSAIQRSEIWHQRRLLDVVESTSSQENVGSLSGSFFYVLLATAWFVYNIMTANWL